MFSTKVGFIDVFGKTKRLVETFPFTVSPHNDSDHILQSGSDNDGFTLQKKGLRIFLFAPSEGSVIYINGVRGSSMQMVGNKEYSIVLGGRFFLLSAAMNPTKWMNKIVMDQWMVHDLESAEKHGPVALPAVLPLYERFADRSSIITYPPGASVGAFVSHLTEAIQGLTDFSQTAAAAMDFRSPVYGSESADSVLASAPDSEIDSEHGELTCPTCWLHFDTADVMNIATHASLRGDSKLGEDAMQRFVPSRFNDSGIALDAMGIPSPEMSCPHCHRKLPTGFLDDEHHIFSIVGAPTSGKSYYLAILIRELQTTLYRHFEIAFRDADPSLNANLNLMKNRLSSGASPAEVALDKTGLEGAMYELLPRYGQKVMLPKPFIFRLSNQSNSSEGEMSVIFYDNAGEHFEPGRSSADSPGAQHVASASTIFFLFDPLNSNAFRQSLEGTTDPGANSVALDQQDVILAETETRMKSLLGLGRGERVATPFAFIVGKGDALGHLISPGEIEPIVVDGQIDQDAVDRNSARVRAMLLEYHSAVVANAEAISSDVRYFLISAFGSAPVRFKAADGSSKIGPDPKRIRPQFIEHPTLWALSRVAPHIVTSR